MVSVPDTFQLWDRFVRKNTIDKNALDLGEALFFAFDIRSPSFVIELSRLLSEASKKSGLQIISRKLDQAANREIIWDIPVIQDALMIDNDNNVSTFIPKKLADLRKIGKIDLKYAYWNFSQLIVEENHEAQQGFFVRIFKSSSNNSLDPSLKEHLANFLTMYPKIPILWRLLTLAMRWRIHQSLFSG